MPKLTRGRSWGFTLIELLVAIAVIALLVGLLLPALGKARASARAVACLSNTRTIALVMQMYAEDDEDNFYPTARMPGMGPDAAPFELSWLYLTGPYVDATAPQPARGESPITPMQFASYREQLEVYACPSDRAPNWDDKTMPRMASYGINAYFTPNHPPYWGVRPDEIAFPTRTVLAAEQSETITMPMSGEVMGNPMDHFMPMFWGDPPAVAEAMNPMVFAVQWDKQTATPNVIEHTRHPGEAANYIFTDGHAAALGFDETWRQTPGEAPDRDWYDTK